ncbi:hypothetical protein PR202_gb29476 [Eleusine coracana subsp. coracana]|uniref:Pectin acetylesterase n=1 Tax=Eleusine coracana subsp. coracana TaxID=191504 RepID=A0AAV5FZD9_ELECO|nr:hypothetical protein PR202_gb29476 [Eleusine coracana subsp. coracana]
MELLSSVFPQRPRQRRAWALAILLLLLSGLRPLHCSSQDLDVIDLTLLAGAHDKGAVIFDFFELLYDDITVHELNCSRLPAISVCLDGSPAGYHLQTGSGTGSENWMIHLQGGGWCSTIQGCSDRRMGELGSSNFMKAMSFSGILSNDQQ